MIGFLKGSVGYLAQDYCLLETAGGVGYRVFMPSAHLAQLSLGAQAQVHVHTAVREDAILLYGFLSQEYYNLFELLLSVSGVGPKMALGILSAVKPEAFYLAVQSRDVKALTKLPGIGKKTAERMLLELKDKLGGAIGDVGSDFEETVAAGGSGSVAEAMEALQSLGYSNSEIMPVIKQIADADKLSGEEVLRQALKLFARR
ncbi:Holliday junction branch migration protein RuvA [uncultured Phascolarctobacterium sp.]|uniref:Holliday junction branch migration protein RuvA n=1 Tax=uncultured Phascolarctobacterium sp. TaxID=512296 RepID=UPI0026167F61|nr:Holliday junction branch migration protein RuvA [uncultured Phascolarctobacterium sp.]